MNLKDTESSFKDAAVIYVFAAAASALVIDGPGNMYVCMFTAIFSS